MRTMNKNEGPYEKKATIACLRIIRNRRDFSRGCMFAAKGCDGNMKPSQVDKKSTSRKQYKYGIIITKIGKERIFETKGKIETIKS